ncbi:glutaredoxin 3 [Acuticoccus sp. I52.16.1]|uniref:glutaredoxin 3 n=1 Tax=Acuticoccus sp. I52.16.1 TaxID=2928472 RepID=UPI001FD4C7DD|nr:glutaredoxin 3 [Acuticoccus sp. I52.16.1]UOM36068.1 glutaredoxin 3 [Acuticoccus sp. I52.16.1]
MTRVEVFTRDLCGFCTRAKRLLEDKGIAFTEYNATKDPSLREVMVKRSGQRTFPQIFVGDIHIGGCDDLYAAERSGKLDAAISGEIAQ